MQGKVCVYEEYFRKKYVGRMSYHSLLPTFPALWCRGGRALVTVNHNVINGHHSFALRARAPLTPSQSPPLRLMTAEKAGPPESRGGGNNRAR